MECQRPLKDLSNMHFLSHTTASGAEIEIYMKATLQHHGESFYVCNINPPPNHKKCGSIFVVEATDLTNTLNES